jgi:hypothetical protein
LGSRLKAGVENGERDGWESSILGGEWDEEGERGIVNGAKLWASETMNNPTYSLDLQLRVITVSLETIKIVNGLRS